MVTISKPTRLVVIAVAWTAAVALAAEAPDVPGARPGDDALTCDQIYAQGMAESQHDQQEREQKRQQMKAEQMGTAALITSAIATGGATAPIAQKAAEANADKTMAMFAAPQQVNPRLARLKLLWAQKQCVMK